MGRGGWLIAAAVAVSCFGVGGVACDSNDNSGLFAIPNDQDSGLDGGDSGEGGVIDLGPIAGLPGAALDLGMGDCGGAAVTKTAEFVNTGSKALEVGLATNAPFTITPATLSVPPGGKGTVSLSVAVPSTATAGKPITGSVVVTTNDPSKPSVTVPVSITPAGATLAFVEGSPTNADFGTGKLGVKDTDISLTLKNVGNKAATFAIGAPADAQFSVVATPASPAALDANASVTVLASFTPDKLTPSTSASNITVNGAVCGASVTKIPVAGQGTVGDVTGWPAADLDFGVGACGGAASPAKTFTLTNAGSADATITGVTFTGTVGYTVNITPGTKINKNNGTLDVTVTPPAIPFPSAVPGSYGDTITFTTDIPNDAPHSINLALAASGAILELDTTATADFGNFGKVPVSTTASQGFAVKNTGNAATSVTASAGSGPFSLSTAAAFDVAAGNTSSLDALFEPTNIEPQTGSITLAATGLCQPLPSAQPLSGQGQSGGISLSTNSLAFQANCGTTADPKTFTITNNGNEPMTWTAVLGAGADSVYDFSPPTETLAPGALSTITVTPKAIPQYPNGVAPELYADIIKVTTDIAGDTEHVIALGEVPLGAILSFQPASIGFDDVPVNTSSAPSELRVVNSGNLGTVADVIVASDNALYTVNTPSGAATPGNDGAFTTTLTFSPGAAPEGSKAKLSVTTTSPLCAPLPTEIEATGRGTLAQVVYGPSDLDFGLVNCGSTAGPKTVTFTNPGNQDYTLTAALKNGTAYAVTLNPASGVVPKNNGGAVVITLTPKAIPQTVPSVPDSATYSDELTVTTTAANDTPHKINLGQGARGVILKPLVSKAWDFGVVNYGATGFHKQSLRNDGNVPVTVSMPDITLPEFGFSPVTVAGKSSATIAGSFTPSAPAGAFNDFGTLTVPADTVLCQPLPNYDITMQGKGGDGSTLYVTGGLAFPNAECNSAANPAQNITIHNLGNTPLDWVATLDVGTWYTITSGKNGTVPANSIATVSVQPKVIAAGPNTYSGSSNYNDRLVLNVGGNSYNYPISQTAVGADLTSNYWYYNYDTWASDYNEYNGYSGSNYSFFTTNGYYQDTAYIQVTNNGNRTGTMNTTFSTPADWTALPLNIPPSTTQTQEWRFRATSQTRSCGYGPGYTAYPAPGPAVCNNQVPTAFGVTGYLYNCNYSSQ
jgi:hypothetical protein